MESTFFSRSMTYGNWSSLVSSTQLAAEGFIYTGIHDTIKCTGCGIELSDLNENNIFQRHYRASQDCRFVQEKLLENPKGLNDDLQSSTTNVNVTDHSNTQLNNGLSHTNETTSQNFNQSQNIENRNRNRRPAAKMPQYDSETARLASFKDWPSTANASPSVLARAGLFYTGERDKVKCPYCLGSMFNWEPEDNPLTEHAKHYQQCAFVMWKTKEHLNPVRLVEYCVPAASAAAQAPAYSVLTDSPLKSSNTLKPQKTDLENLKVVQIVANMGYSLKLIKAACKRIPNFEPLQLKSEVLLDAIFELENDGFESDESNDSCDRRSTGYVEEKVEVNELAYSCSKAGNFPTKQKKHEGENTPKEKYNIDMKMSPENQKLHSNNQCIVCRNKAADSLILPCRHLVCCDHCSLSEKQCPKCNSIIEATVKIYMS